MRLVRCEDGQLEIALEPSAPKTLVHDLQRKLDRLDRQALDGGRVEGAGRADDACAEPRRSRPSSSAACSAIRWCRRCSAASPAPRSSVSTQNAPAPAEPAASDRRLRRVNRSEELNGRFHGPDEAGRRSCKSKMQAMQAELDQIEVEGTAGGGLVTVKLTAKGDLKGVKIDDSLLKPVGKGNSRGPAGRRACRRAAQGRSGAAGKDEGRHRRPAAAAGIEVLTYMPTAVAGPEIERLIQLLARLPGLGPRSARRAALHLIKKRELMMAPLAAALADRDGEDRDLQGLRQYRHAKSLHGLHRRQRDQLDHRGGGRRRRPVGAGTRARRQRPLSRARRHAVAARRRRPAGPHDRRADFARARRRR